MADAKVKICNSVCHRGLLAGLHCVEKGYFVSLFVFCLCEETVCMGYLSLFPVHHRVIFWGPMVVVSVKLFFLMSILIGFRERAHNNFVLMQFPVLPDEKRSNFFQEFSIQCTWTKHFHYYGKRNLRRMQLFLEMVFGYSGIHEGPCNSFNVFV